jgi:hypothetical protein
MLSTAACSRQDAGRAPDRTGAHPDATRTQPAANFFHCQVWFGSDQLQQPSLVRIQQRTLAADQLSRHRSGLPPARNPPIAELGTSNAAAASWQDASCLHRTHHPFTQITRIGLRHRCPPNLIRRDSPISMPLRIPSVSLPNSTQSDYAGYIRASPIHTKTPRGCGNCFFSRGSGKSSRLRRGSGTIG